MNTGMEESRRVFLAADRTMASESRLAVFAGGVILGGFVVHFSDSILHAVGVALPAGWMVFWMWRYACSSNALCAIISHDFCEVIDVDGRQIIACPTSRLTIMSKPRKSGKTRLILLAPFGPPVTLWVTSTDAEWISKNDLQIASASDRVGVRTAFYACVLVIMMFSPVIMFVFRDMIASPKPINTEIIGIVFYIAIIACALWLRHAHYDILRFRSALRTLIGRQSESVQG